MTSIDRPYHFTCFELITNFTGSGHRAPVLSALISYGVNLPAARSLRTPLILSALLKPYNTVRTVRGISQKFSLSHVTM